MLDCEFIDSQSDVGGVSGVTGARTIVTGQEGSSLELRFPTKMLHWRDGATGLLMSAIAAQ